MRYSTASGRGGGKPPHPQDLFFFLSKKGLVQNLENVRGNPGYWIFGTAPKLTKRAVYLLLGMGTAGSALLGICR